MTDLTALIERLEKAEGPSRELDAEICVAVQHDLPSPMGDCKPVLRLPRKDDRCEVGTVWLVQLSGQSLRASPVFTSSIDAALTLVPEGWTVARISQGDSKLWCVELRRGFLTSYGEVIIAPTNYKGSLPAIAICNAALRARNTTND